MSITLITFPHWAWLVAVAAFGGRFGGLLALGWHGIGGKGGSSGSGLCWCGTSGLGFCVGLGCRGRLVLRNAGRAVPNTVNLTTGVETTKVKKAKAFVANVPVPVATDDNLTAYRTWLVVKILKDLTCPVELRSVPFQRCQRPAGVAGEGVAFLNGGQKGTLSLPFLLILLMMVPLGFSIPGSVASSYAFFAVVGGRVIHRDS